MSKWISLSIFTLCTVMLCAGGCSPININNDTDSVTLATTVEPQPTSMSTPLSTSLAKFPTLIATMPGCPGGALLYLDPYEQDVEGRILSQLNWICSDDSTVRLVASEIQAYDFAISPQGDHIVLAGQVIGVINLSDQKIAVLSKEVPTESYYYPSWSPNGEYIVYLRHRSTADSSIEVIHAPSGTVSDKLLPNELVDLLVEATVAGIEWLSWGDQILVYGNVTQDMYLLDVACDQNSHKCEASQIREAPVGRDIKERPTVSPDGTQIAALCILPDKEPVEIALCVYAFNGDLVSEISLDEIGLDYFYNLSWSPDGSRLAFDDGASLYILNLSDRSVRGLNVHGFQPIWLP